MAERGQSLESIKASIDARKPDFDAFIGKAGAAASWHAEFPLPITQLNLSYTRVSSFPGADPQKQYADAVIEVLPTQLIPDDEEGKVPRVRLIMKEGVRHFDPVYLFDEGSVVTWIPCGRKLSCSYPGIKFAYGFGTYFGNEVSVLEMDGHFDKLDELIYVETHLSNMSSRFYGEVTQQMLKLADLPGSNNGTGLFQTIVALKVRDLYEQIVAERADDVTAGALRV